MNNERGSLLRRLGLYFGVLRPTPAEAAAAPPSQAQVLYVAGAAFVVFAIVFTALAGGRAGLITGAVMGAASLMGGLKQRRDAVPEEPAPTG